MTRAEFARMRELTAVAPDTKVADVERLARDAAACGSRAVYTLPCYTPLLVSLMRKHTATVVGGAIGFPSGAVTTLTKVAEAAEAAEMLRVGCGEFDMVMSFGMLMSGDDGYVVDDIRRVKDAAGGIRSLQTVHDLFAAEARRFGVGAGSAGAIFAQLGD